MANLLKARNPALTDKRTAILAEVSVHGINSLILHAIRGSKSRQQEIFHEIETLMKAYLQEDLGDEVANNNSVESWHEFTQLYQLNSRQSLILKYTHNYQEITIQNCEAMFPDISRRTLQRDLKAMLEQKLLIPQGNTDQRCYCLNYELLNL
jgi:predicted HTH transcriptional regulator